MSGDDHGLNCPVCGSGEFGDCVCPVSGDDHGAGLDLDAVTKVMREHRGTVPDPEKSSNEWVSWMCQCGGSIRGGHDRHIAREILAALDAEPSDAP